MTKRRTRVNDDATTAECTPGFTRRLTPRETEVGRLLAGGLDNAGIAAKLGLSKKTVEHHVERIYAAMVVEADEPPLVSRVKAAALFWRAEGNAGPGDPPELNCPVGPNGPEVTGDARQGMRTLCASRSLAQHRRHDVRDEPSSCTTSDPGRSQPHRCTRSWPVQVQRPSRGGQMAGRHRRHPTSATNCRYSIEGESYVSPHHD